MSRDIREAVERVHSGDSGKMPKTVQESPKGLQRRAAGNGRAQKTSIVRMARVVGIVACVALVACLIFATIYYYNQYKTCMVKLDQDKALWDNEIQRRASLLPNLALIAAKYSAHEKVLFEYVTEIRRSLGKANGGLSSDTPDSPLNKLMSPLLAISERYPDLKATQSFELLMQGMIETTNRITQARTTYIKSIKVLNDLYAKFPSNIFGRLLFVTNREQWKVDASVASDIDLEKTFQKVLAARAAAKSQRPVESESVSPRGDLVETDRVSTPDQRERVSPEGEPE
jgi:LemA protein